MRGAAPVAGLVILGGMLVSLLAGCGRAPAPQRPDDSGRLYRETLALAKACSDSILAAPDSAAAKDAFDRLSEMLDSLNFAVAPDTDLRLSEAQNDTIFLTLTSLRALLEERLDSLKTNPYRD